MTTTIEADILRVVAHRAIEPSATSIRAAFAVRSGVCRSIAAFTAFLLVLLWGGLGLHLGELRDKELEHASLSAVSLSRTAAEYASRLFRTVDQSLTRIKTQYERAPDSFDLSAAVASDSFLKDVAFRVIHVREDGMGIAANGPPSPPAFLGDLPSFLYFKESPDSSMLIGKPSPGQLTGRSDIRITRRLEHADGSFAGILVVLLDPHYLSDFFRNLEIGRTGFVSLIGLDGVVRARLASGDDTGVGQDMSNAPLFKEIQKGPIGSYQSDSPIDKVPRTVGYRILQEYPILASVGLGRDEILADYHGERVLLVAIAALISLLFIGAAVILLRQMAIQMRTELLLRQREQELTRSRNVAEHASRSKSEFLANMSHELRTPLNAIIGFSEIMIEGVMGPIGSPKYLDYAKDIHRSGTHLLDLISGILDMSKIEAGHYKLSLEEVDLAELSEICVRILAGKAEQARITLFKQVAADLPPLNADARAMRQILINLLSNAVKFTPAGGSVTLKADWAADGMVVIAVNDTGIGIAEHDLGRIGQPFQQVEDNAHNRRHEGAGLGLAITKQLVELHGGSLDIASSLGSGTTVTVRLPVATAPAAALSATG